MIWNPYPDRLMVAGSPPGAARWGRVSEIGQEKGTPRVSDRAGGGLDKSGCIGSLMVSRARFTKSLMLGALVEAGAAPTFPETIAASAASSKILSIMTARPRSS